MALGDPTSRYSVELGMPTRFRHASVPNHLDELAQADEHGEVVGSSRGACQRSDAEASSSGVGSSSAVVGAATSLAYLPQTVFLCESRHDLFEACVPSGPSDKGLVSKWRPKDRMRTGCVALVLCLNISVDPPDVIKISPCARLECWIDPFSMAAPKALESIGKALHNQYERWQPRARYKLQLDPTVDEVKKLCNTCRKNAKSERVVFHYNGHGVPKPTANGEIWVFNKSYTQYIPLPISDLDSWLRTPSLYVFDCSAAGMIVNAFLERQDWNSTSTQTPSMKDIILLAACEAHETLPQSAEFPADVFTSCLTTPIKMALRWFCNRSLLRDPLFGDIIDKIPGRQNDRKTPLGELNWIFTAVTDTIAWNVLPHDHFQRLFRQDLLVASLFRNFLLAERIMRSANCSPISYPMLPPTHQHHMWDAWDMAAEICLSQLLPTHAEPDAEFQPSPFFTEQLTAFELWLEHGSEHKRPPEQLPIVLQVLLSQSHRFRALVLLGKFLDMGPWAVDLALSVGIFPYVLKLLQTTAVELRQILVFIWTKILALDKSCQIDLVKDGGHEYFIKFLNFVDAYPEQRAMAAFVLAVIVDGHKHGQEACIQSDLIGKCLQHLNASTHDAQTEPLLLQWLCLCLGKLWEDFPEAQLMGLQYGATSIFEPLLSEPQPEVRAAAVFGLGTLLDVGSNSLRDGLRCDDDCDDDEKSRTEFAIVQSLFDVVTDGSPLVRAEVAVALSRFAFGHNKHLKSIAAAYWKSQSNSLLSALPSLTNIRNPSTGYAGSSQFLHSASVVPTSIGPVLRVGGDGSTLGRDGKSSASSPLPAAGIMHGSPLSDSSERSDSAILLNDATSNGIISLSKTKTVDNAVYSQFVMAVYALAKDPSPRIAGIGRRILSMIGIEQIPTNTFRPSGGSIQQTSSLANFTRSSSWLDMNAGRLPMSFRTPPVSPPRQSYLAGMRRVCSLEFRPNQLSSADSGLADSLLGSVGMSDRCLLPQSTIYNWSSGHFSRPLLTSADDNEEALSRREEKERLAWDCIAKCQHSSVSNLENRITTTWDVRSDTGTKAMLMHPFSPIVIAADENERIRVWNHEDTADTALLNTFENHNFREKGVTKLCLVNELDDSLLLVASCDGNIRVWKDYTQSGRQKLVTAFSSIQGHRPGARGVNAVVDWQQLTGYLYAAGEISSIMVWDMDKEQRVTAISSLSDSSISALSAAQVHGGQLAAGYVDGHVRLFDVRTPERHICTMKPHSQSVERVVGISFQPGLDPVKIVSASQAGEIQFMDIRRHTTAYLTIEAHRRSLTALAVHRHAPVIASGSAKQIIKVFSLEGEQLSVIRYYPTFMAQKIGAVSCLSFHPYRVLLAAGTGSGPTDACISIYADENSAAR